MAQKTTMHGGKQARGGGAQWAAFALGALAAAAVWLALHAAPAPLPGARPSAPDSGGQARPQPTAAGPAAAPAPGTPAAAADPEPSVRVYLAGEGRVETVPLETYVRGVVAAEMPAGFRPAALEAQALAARTYIVRRLWLGAAPTDPAAAAAGADVTDTVADQAYDSLKEMDRLRAKEPDAWAKISGAVERTRGRVLTYGGEPIEALYFSTSNGYTENSEEVFPFRLPYLRSVPSPWDAQGAPRSEEKTEMPLADFLAKLGAAGAGQAVAAAGGSAPAIRVLERTAGHRVRLLAVGDKTLAGGEVRNKLGLRSADFTLSLSADKRQIEIDTRGSGHGVGMSQWGAEGMAEAGSTAEQIVKHYYTGISIGRVSEFLPKDRKG